MSKKTKKHDNLSGLNKWKQIKNRHELFEADYLDQLSPEEALMAIQLQ